jgi:hypothetical protein
MAKRHAPQICACAECQAEDRRPLQGIEGTAQFELPTIRPAKRLRRESHG